MPTSPADAAFAANMKSFRSQTSMTQAQLAEKMASRGFKWHPATVYKVENGERQIQFAEAVEIARIFGNPIERMAEHSQDLALIRELVRSLRSVRSTLMHDLHLLPHDAARVANELDKPGVREQVSDGEYREMLQEANLPPEVAEALSRAWHALNDWARGNCFNCGRPRSGAACTHCGFVSPINGAWPADDDEPET